MYRLIPLERGWSPLTGRTIAESKTRVRLLCSDGRIRQFWRLSGLPVGGGFLRIDPAEIHLLREEPCTT